jgi:ADP-L-glycero-D-manno-heptose 6-epimerase
MSSSKKIIVTGGAGFIGSAVVWRLNQSGEDNILIVDRLDETDKWKNLAPLKYADYLDADDFLDDLDEFSNARAVIHLGACSSTTERDSAYLMRNNYQYTRDLAEWAVNNNIRFIYASSAATYGDGSNGMLDGYRGIQSLRPLNMYGYSKHLFDLYAKRRRLFDGEGGIVGLKYFNVFGPNEDHKGDMRSLINKAFTQIQETGRLQLFKSHNPDYTDGEFGRDFVYVKDAVDMTLHFLNRRNGGLFNIGSGRMTTWNKLAAAIFAALKREPEIEYIDMPEHLRDRYQYRTEANISQLQLETDYTKTIMSLNEAVADYVQKYLVPGKHLGE